MTTITRTNLRGLWSKCGLIQFNSGRPVTKNSPLPLKVARRAEHRNRLIHHPLANTEVVIDPLLEVLVIGDLVGAETGAG